MMLKLEPAIVERMIDLLFKVSRAVEKVIGTRDCTLETSKACLRWSKCHRYSFLEESSVCFQGEIYHLRWYRQERP